MGESNSRWMVVWTAAGALATAGGVVVAVLVAGSPEAEPTSQPPAGDPNAVVTTTTTSTSSKVTTRTTARSPRPAEPTTRNVGDRQEKEFDLQGKLSDEFANCDPKRDLTAETAAALNCVATNSGPSRKPLVIQFPGTSAMDAFYDSERRGLTGGGNCSAGQNYTGTWKWNGVIKGQMVCKKGTTFRIFWSYYGEKIGFAAESENAAELYQWWSKHGCKAIS
nr:hypothetical protein [Kibdelosporangium sp. MJ126-NF4]CEL23102.1 hypothetical protein [Kibdelosporangium sp. MJ126-NF4]CTQ90239.1 hypothetical protein [Kibdelosporangium sp. MJ126-NF4]